MSTLKKHLRSLASPANMRRYHWLQAAYAVTRFGQPAKKMLVFGITGTKGKTTSCHLLAAILEQAGLTVGLATTVSFKIGTVEERNDTNMSVTAPYPLQKLLRRMRRANVNAIVLEVTSIALDQHRTLGIPFSYASFTNLAHDHLDYHGDMASYAEAKRLLFKKKELKAVTANLDDALATSFLDISKAPKKLGFSRQIKADVFAQSIKELPSGSHFTLLAGQSSVPVKLQLPGLFSISNALCAASLAYAHGLSLETIAKGLESVNSVAGRLELVPTGRDFQVMVDYAHTPDSLEQLYASLRGSVSGRLIAVLGATGDRDRTKRPIMGAIAGRLCDLVIITDEEPYSESPQSIIEAVAEGVPRGRTGARNEPGYGENVWWWKILERKAGIAKALALAKQGDMVVVTGMGAQHFRTIGNQKEPWNDSDVITSLLNE